MELDRRITDFSSSDIDIRLLELAYRNVPPMLAVNIAAATGATFVLASNGLSATFLWLAGVLTLTLLRLLSWMGFEKAKRNPPAINLANYRYWRNLYAAGLYIAALFWIGLFCVCLQLTNQDGKYTLSIIISALAGGATGITAPLKIQGRNYITLMLLVPAIALAFSEPTNMVLALLCGVFLVAMLISHNNNHKVLRQSLTLQRENSELIEDLREANSSLERRVSNRTEALKRIAYRDALTGLSNRRDILEWMEKHLNKDNQEEAPVLFLDLDRFKQINDVLGHDIGDQVLQAIALRFKDKLPKDAILGRWGGDEFIIICAQAPSARQRAEALAKELIDAATAPFEMSGELLGLGLSVGVAYFPTDANNYKDVIQAADLSVAEVKRTGRGKMLTYTDTYAETQRRRFDLSRALTEAIADNHLHLMYQPIVSAHTGAVVALEALARWNHPLLGDIDPEEFIRLAEDTDRILALGDWVLRHACEEASAWHKQHCPQKIAVNVSIKQLLSENFCERLMEILSACELQAEHLQLEVTESLFNDENIESTLETVIRLRELGVEIHIDDFGTGYSSLSRLHQFPVNTIKIDRSFIARTHNPSTVIIESTVMIAKHMHLKVIAEGVENSEQARALTQLGVDYLQGFYFAQPERTPRLAPYPTTWKS